MSILCNGFSGNFCIPISAHGLWKWFMFLTLFAQLTYVNVLPENRSHILLSQLGWMNIQNRINFRKAVMIFKSLNNLAPQYMINMFNYVPNTVNTQQLTSYNRKDLQIPTGTHKMIYVNSFAYSSVKVWNSILPHVRNCHSLSSFKAGYLKHHFNGF